MPRTLSTITRDLLLNSTEFEIFESEELQKRIDELRDERTIKEDGIFFFYKDFDKEIDIFTEQIGKAQRYVKWLKSEQERLKMYVVSQFQLTGDLPKHTVLNPLKVRESAGAVDIIDEAKIPDTYWVEVVTRKLDKKRILKELKDGNIIPGVRLQPNMYLVS